MAATHEELRKIYRFDEFEIDARKRVLLRDGNPVTLNSKAFDLLLALVANGGRELSKDQLMQWVWRDQIVEENNLAVHIYNLRKLLGERKDRHRYIITIPGVGYRFVADVSETPAESDELFIESHAVSRFVVEETEISENPKVIRRISRDVVLSTPEFEAATSTAPASLVQSRKRKSVLLAVVLVGLLLTGGFGGYWIYRNRLQGISSSSSPASRQRMVMTRVTDSKHLGAPTISPDGKFIAYIENAPVGAGSLFVQQTDTNTVLQLLDPADRVFGCTNFSADGSLIYYIVFDKRDPHGALYSIPVLGGTPKRITGDLGSYFSLSPDGKRVAFYRHDYENNGRRLMLVALDGSGEQTLLTSANHELRFSGSLAWSADGKLIAIIVHSKPDDTVPGSTLFGVEVNTGAAKPLMTERFYEIGKMSWTTDGRSLVFVAKRPRSENQLYLLDYPSGAVRHITNDMETYGNYGLGITADSGTLVADVFETMSELWGIDANGDAQQAIRVKSGTTNGRAGLTTLPDGRIAYVARSGDTLDIWTVREDGSDAKALTSDSFTQRDVAASPDGRYLVFASDHAGETHIFRMNADDGSEVTQLTFGTSYDSSPDVSPDGAWVIYVSSDGQQTAVWRVPLAGGASQQITDYECRAPVFAPDGKTIACVLPSDSRVRLASIAIIPAEGGKPVTSFQVLPFSYTYYPSRWSPDGKSLVFRKSTNGVSNLWQQPLSGGAPQQLTHLSSDSIWNFAYSRDGNRIYLSRGTTFVDVVLIKNFR